MQALPLWDELRLGVGCPLCAGHQDTSLRRFVRTLRMSSLYLSRRQTYRGSCVLIMQGRHVNSISELTSEEWLQLAQDLRDSERAILRVFMPDHINIECLGNTVPHLSWDLIPRYKNDGRWGQPIWTTARSELKHEFLPDSAYASYVRELDAALDAL